MKKNAPSAIDNVLVLGAGVSAEYHFPTGKQLIDYILQEFIYEGPGIRDQLLPEKITKNISHNFDSLCQAHTEIKPEDIYDFFRRLQNARPPSIDLFLQTLEHYKEVGQTCIAYIIGKHEIKKYLTSPEAQSTWDPKNIIRPKYITNDRIYDTIWKKFRSKWRKFEDFPSNYLSIITFNYDRSLEQFLYDRIYATFSQNEKACKEVLNKFNIIHMYGQIGELVFSADQNQWDNPSSSRLYYPHLNMLQAKQLGQLLKIIDSERSNVLDTSQKAQNLISNAKKVLFLGFGYEENNLKLLNPGLSNRKKHSISLGTFINNLDGKEKDLSYLNFGGIKQFHINPFGTSYGPTSTLSDFLDVVWATE